MHASTRPFLKFVMLLAALLIMSRGPAFAQGAMTNGDNHTGSISAPGQVDAWTFTAVAGDAISLSIGEVGENSAFWPWIRLFAPNGAQLGSNWGQLAATIGVTGAATGTYTVWVASADSGNDDTGDYQLTLARTPAAFVVPAGDQGGAMTNGENHPGTIHRADLDQWTFTANAGDAISVSIGEVGANSAFWPWIRLRAPNGAQLGSNWGQLAAQLNVSATLTGTYTVVVASADSGNQEVGDYLLTLALTPGAFVVPPGDEGGPMTNGANHPGTVHRADLDQWTFTANAGDAISVSIGEVGTNTPFWPWIRVRAPNGAQLGNNWGQLAATIDVTATLNGTYTVVVGSADSGNQEVGDYLLTLARTPGAFVVPPGDQGGPMTNGENHPGTIHRADIDQWTFTANAGDAISVSIGEVGTNTPFWPWIRLRAPNGAQLGSNWGQLAAQLNVSATLTGTYTVLVASADSGNQEVGDYLLTLARTPGTFVVPPGDHGGAMTNGANHPGTIHRADLDQWTFTANAGDAISLSIGEVGTNTPFWPWIRLRAPNGAQLGSNWGQLAATIDVTATLNGTYTVVVGSADSGNQEVGDYLLTLAKTPGTFVVPLGDQGGAMTPDTEHPGTIHRADIDQWTLTAPAGATIRVNIGEVGGNGPFWPWIRLRGPNGALVGSNWGQTAAQIQVIAPSAGTYTVLVASADSGNQEVGDYVLSGTVIGVSFTVTPSAGPNGTISPNTPQSVPSGETRSFTLTPSPGYRVNQVSGTCGGTLVGLVFTTNPVTQNCSVIATFTQITLPTMSLDKTSLRFGAVTTGGGFVYQTPQQIARLTQTGVGTVTWTLASNQPWLQVSPASGTGSANLTFSVITAAGLPAAGSVNATATLTFTGAGNNPGPVSIALNLIQNGTSAIPIGNVDTPTNNRTGVTGAIPFTGWAIDDVGVARVMICRSAFGAETAPNDPNCGGSAQFFLGFAVSIDGARPDVAAAFPAYPANSAAGWGFMVLTNMLPSQGNGTYQFHIYVQDHDGHTTLVGTRTMTCANTQATLPFGAIDTPTQGGVASGNAYINFGWALTPQPKMIPFNGSTITVVVDGVAVGNPTYNNFRGDIAFLFPGLQNTDGAVGFRIIDTTTLANGLHTIAWVVTDSAGATEGIGSRFFTVSNGASVVAAGIGAESVAAGLLSSEFLTQLPQADGLVSGRRGWDLELGLTALAPANNGRIVMRGEEIDRFELVLGERAGSRYSGHLHANGELASLPIGSTLDPSTGTFTWAPGAGFIGNYDLVFVRWEGTTAIERREVRIVIQPKGRGAVGAQVVIDAPKPQQDVAQPFALGGWAADLNADGGTGISTLHVWAYPLAGGPPVFLGIAEHGRRPDVAAVHGAQFEQSGYGLIVNGLDPGDYDLAVFALSAKANEFLPATVVRVTVR
jgi:hypothetical protein